MMRNSFADRLLVWIVGHVLSGWDGTNALPNPTNLCEHFFRFSG